MDPRDDQDFQPFDEEPDDRDDADRKVAALREDGWTYQQIIAGEHLDPGRRTAAEWEPADPDGPYAPDDPKHPDYHDRMTDLLEF